MQDRYAYRVGRFDNLPFPVEMALSDLISAEIRLLKRLESGKDALQTRYDYSSYAAFRGIDRYNEGNLNVFNLRQFYRMFYSYPSDRELLQVVRRIDTDGDAKVSYPEFSEFMRVNNQSQAFSYGGQ